MPLDSQRPGFYKTIQCRYFDDDGRPLEPYCRMGSRCNYIHPEDSQWERRKNFKKKRFGPSPDRIGVHNRRDSRASSVAPASEYTRPYRDDGPGLSRVDLEYRRGRSPERKPADLERPPDRPRSRERGHYERPAVIDPEVHATSKVASYSAYRDRDLSSPRVSTRHTQPSITQDHESAPRTENKEVQPTSTPLSRPTLPPPSFSHSSTTQEKIAESFKAIASIVTQFMLDSAACDKEHEKLETYNNLSSTLAKVSPASVAAIAPTLASVISSHSQQREKVQADLKRLTDIWEDIMALFVQSTQKTIDTRMDNAVARIREEADREIARIRAAVVNAEPIRPLNALQKRKYEEETRRWDDRPQHRNDLSRELARYDRESDRSPEGKRARLGDVPYTGSPHGPISSSETRNGHNDNLHSYSSSRAPSHHTSPVQQSHGSSGTHQLNQMPASSTSMDIDRNIHLKDHASVASSSGNQGRT